MASCKPPTLDQAIKEITELSNLQLRLQAEARNNVIRVIDNKIRSLRSIQATRRDLLKHLITLSYSSAIIKYNRAAVDEAILGVTEDMLAEDGVADSITTGVCRLHFAYLQEPIANDRCS